MPLDPQVAALLALLPPAVPPASLTPQEHRANYRAVVAARRGTDWQPEAVGSSADLQVAGLPCRLHRPAGVQRPAVLVFLHGGGWVVGDLDTHEAIARSLCARAGIAVLAVDYRLAPERPYPAPLEDCLAVARWAGEQDFAAVAVGGDSAGGGLAAAVALVFRAEGRPLAGQLLIYPALDGGTTARSYASMGEGYGLTAEQMRWYWDAYAGPADRADPLLSPAAAVDLTGLAPAVIATAGYDVLRDEGDAHAARLAAAGVPVWHRQYPGLVHGFAGSGALVTAADQAITEIAYAVRDLLT